MSPNKLFTSNFIKVCLSNLLLFVTLYLVLPILPFALNVEMKQVLPSWSLLLFFAGGLILGGPLHNYFIENYSRKKVCTLAYFGVAAPMLLYIINIHPLLYVAAALIQGFCFGVATAANVTIAIDVTDASKRNKGNLIFAWSGRLGMILAIPIGIVLFMQLELSSVIYISLICGIIAAFLIRITKTPFRAPIGSTTFSFDRFFLPSGWKLVLMMLTLAFVVGSIFPLFFNGVEFNILSITNEPLDFILLPFVIFFSSVVLGRLEIDALYHQKWLGFIILRLPLLFIALYFYFEHKGHLSFTSLVLIGTLILQFLYAIVRGMFHQKIVDHFNKWQLTPHIRTEVVVPIFSGLICILLALSLQADNLLVDDTYTFRIIIQLLIFGLARVSSPILMVLLVSSKHCERSTANTSHILAWEIGLATGCATNFALQLTETQVLHLSLLLLGSVLILHLWVFSELRQKVKEHIAQMKHKEQ